ncbi:hypothetical protein HB364_00540 [Pseudoflavitalea sp. X16]|uniref:hypothetical protein n=1 Tax=Paraflavitalea devenefica TaxID=2716334 RepID=UPI00141E4214|nr:hypothetical protein [Paraflavitalea devenefica]NII23547.1 hypothetical protein [Paraflavitalea devenefica]
MINKNTSGRIYVWIIIGLFLLLACVIWYLFDRQIQRIDKKIEESRATQPSARRLIPIKKCKDML